MIYVVGHVSQMDKVMYVGWCFSWSDGTLGLPYSQAALTVNNWLLSIGLSAENLLS